MSLQKKKDTFSFSCGLKMQLQMYDQLLPHQRHLNRVSPSVQFKCQFHHLLSLANITPLHSDSNMGPSKGQFKGHSHTSAGQEKPLPYSWPCYSYSHYPRHMPGPVIPRAIIHTVCLAPLFLPPLSTPYTWPHYSYSQYSRYYAWLLFLQPLFTSQL